MCKSQGTVMDKKAASLFRLLAYCIWGELRIERYSAHRTESFVGKTME